MFNSVFTSIRSQTDKLKEKVNLNLNSFNSRQFAEFSAKLKTNVIEKSAWIQSSVSQRLEPYLLSIPNINNIDLHHPHPETSKGESRYQDQYQYPSSANPYNFSHSTSAESRSLSSYFRTKLSLGLGESAPMTTDLEMKRQNNNERDIRRIRREKRKGREREQRSRTDSSGGSGKPKSLLVMSQNANKTWIEMDKRNNPGRNGGENGNDSQLSSSTTSSEDEDISERFERVISITRTTQMTTEVADRPELQKRRSDRDEIRRRLALESEELGDKPGGRKPSLHSRLQSSMNLQICFINLNETASDSESPGSDTEAQNSQQPASLPCIKAQSGSATVSKTVSATDPSEDFCTKQMRLQAEARHALSQAKEMARLQMTQEKERRLQSPITEMVRNSLRKVGMSLPPERRRVSRQLLTEMNVTQLQVIVNDLHTHIEVLNETLVSMLLERDDLHMEQDSMLVDIEDLTRYLAAKDNSPHQSLPLITPGKSILGKK